MSIRSNLLWFALVAFAALLQTTWPDILKVQEVLPDITLLLVVYFALTAGAERAMYTGLLGGVYQDVASNSVLGHHVLCHVVVGYAVARISMRLITDHPALKAGLVFLAALADGILFTTVLFVQEPGVGFLYTVVASVVPGAFYTTVLTPFAFAGLSLMFEGRKKLQRGLT